MRKSKEGPQWAMGTSKRVEYRGSDAPGPGGYNITYTYEGPQYTMGGKVVETRVEHSPGPGQYNPADEAVRQSAPGYKIGTESKDFKDMTSRKDVPGPGQYELKSSKETVAYGFGSAQREQVIESGSPGPG